MKMKKTLLKLVVLLLSAMAFADWAADKPVGKWFEDDGDRCYVFKKDSKSRIYMDTQKDDNYRDILNLYIYTDKGNTLIRLSRPSGTFMPYDERLDMWNKFVPIVNKHIKKSYADFVEAMKKESQQLLLETAFLKPEYKQQVVATPGSVERVYTGPKNGAVTYTKPGGSRLETVRDPSQDMHVRPYKIILGEATGETGISSFNNRPYETIEYRGQL